LRNFSWTVAGLSKLFLEGINHVCALKGWWLICRSHWQNRCLIKICEPEVLGKNEHWQWFFPEETKNERTTDSQRNLDRQENAEMADDRQIPAGVHTVAHRGARKNYQRLCARYPEIMKRLNLNEFSAF
jgi:hypothetical protein